jgi:hypothetical protein
MPEFVMAVAALGSIVGRGAAILGLVYVGARLAIRHERRVSS